MLRQLVLAGPTLDRVMGLVRLGRLDSCPTQMGGLVPGQCVTRLSDLMELRKSAPPDLAPIIEPLPSAPVHLFVSQASEVYASKKLSFHVLSATLPKGSFLQICKGVLVPAWPLYYVLRCAKMQRLVQRLKLGMELCGTYSHVVPGDEATPCFYRQANKNGVLEANYHNARIFPATLATEIGLFVSRARFLRGAGPAREATRYLLEGSASPSETILALMMSLPCKEGGYGFKGVELNPELPVPPELQGLVSTSAYHPDCYLPCVKTDLEMQSYENHLGRRALVHDAARRNDIQTLGVEVKDVTWDTVSRLDKLDTLAYQLLHKEEQLGVSGALAHKRSVLHPDNVARRRVLLSELLPPWPYEQ